MTCQIVSPRDQRFVYSLMTVRCIGTSDASRMPSNFRKTWKHYSSGRATGWWSFTPRSAKSCMSPTRGSAWNIHIASMDTPSKWSTQPSTLGLISTSLLNGTTTSTRSPRRQTRHQPFCGATYINASRDQGPLLSDSCATIMTEYASVIWDPHTAEYTNKLEMVQRRAARMVFSDYRTTSSVSVMISQLNWPTLQERRAQAKATMMYRIVYQLIDIPSTLLVPTISPRGNNITFLVPYARTTLYQKSFFPDGIRIWNALPSEAVSAPSIDSFKSRILPITIRP